MLWPAWSLVLWLPRCDRKSSVLFSAMWRPDARGLETVLFPASCERLLATFEDVFDEFLDCCDIDRAGQIIIQNRSLQSAIDDGRQADNLFSVSQHRNVGVVAGKDELTPALLISHRRYDAVGNKAIV